MANEHHFDFDVFISYSSKDKVWVRGELLQRIEQAGLKVCIDFRDFTAGRSALLNMQDAVRRSRRSLLVISPAWFTSEWTLFDGQTPFQFGHGTKRQKTPLRQED